MAEKYKFNKMNRKIKKAWVAALRSGDYKQTTKKLYNGQGRYCCMGVLCDLYREVEYPKTKLKTFFANVTDNLTLPYEVLDWAGLGNRNPVLSEVKGYEVEAGTLNDGGVVDIGEGSAYVEEKIKRHSFEEIAALIEKNL